MTVVFQQRIASDRYFRDYRFDFLIADELGAQWYKDDCQESWERSWCADRIKPGMTVVDCGAHHGMMTVLMAHWVGPSGRVVSYELFPPNALAVEKNVVLNGLKNVVVRPVGVSDRAGRIGATIDNGNVISAGDDRGGAFEVVSLDVDLAGESRIDFIKVDVEGSDLLALRGASMIIRKFRPILNIELHCSLFGDTPARKQAVVQDILNMFETDGWRFFFQPEPDDEPFGITNPFSSHWIAKQHNPHIFVEPLSIDAR